MNPMFGCCTFSSQRGAALLVVALILSAAIMAASLLTQKKIWGYYKLRKITKYLPAISLSEIELSEIEYIKCMPLNNLQRHVSACSVGAGSVDYLELFHLPTPCLNSIVSNGRLYSHNGAPLTFGSAVLAGVCIEMAASSQLALMTNLSIQELSTNFIVASGYIEVAKVKAEVIIAGGDILIGELHGNAPTVISATGRVKILNLVGAASIKVSAKAGVSLPAGVAYGEPAISEIGRVVAISLG